MSFSFQPAANSDDQTGPIRREMLRKMFRVSTNRRPGMARGRGRGKSSGRSNPAIRVSMPTIPMPTIVSPQQGGTPLVATSLVSSDDRIP